MPYTVFSGTSEDIKNHLDGIIRLGPFPRSGLAIGGMTLAFLDPSDSVVFSGSLGDVLDLPTIRDEINAAIAGVTATLNYTAAARHNVSVSGIDPLGYLILQRDAGITIDDDAGLGVSANAILGIPTSGGELVAAGIGAARLVGFSQSTTPGHYVALISPQTGVVAHRFSAVASDSLSTSDSVTAEVS